MQKIKTLNFKALKTISLKFKKIHVATCNVETYNIVKN